MTIRVAGAAWFCEAVVIDSHSPVAVKICGRPATSKVKGPDGVPYGVCDEHAKDFAPRPGRQVGVLP